MVRWPAAAIVLAGLTGTGARLVEILTETTLQRELDEDVFGRASASRSPPTCIAASHGGRGTRSLESAAK